MAGKRLERFGGSVTGRGKAVRTQPDPGEKCGERKFVENVVVAKIPAFSENECLDAFDDMVTGHGRQTMIIRMAARKLSGEAGYACPDPDAGLPSSVFYQKTY